MGLPQLRCGSRAAARLRRRSFSKDWWCRDSPRGRWLAGGSRALRVQLLPVCKLGAAALFLLLKFSIAHGLGHSGCLSLQLLITAALLLLTTPLLSDLRLQVLHLVKGRFALLQLLPALSFRLSLCPPHVSLRLLVLTLCLAACLAALFLSLIAQENLASLQHFHLLCFSLLLLQEQALPLSRSA